MESLVTNQTISANLKMSTTRRAAKKKDDIFSKKVPENPKYKHVKPTVDTGSSVTRYMEKLEEIRKNYRYKKDEIFKRIKVNTFAQLVLQVAEVISIEQDRDDLSTAGLQENRSNGPLSPAFEERNSDAAADENIPPLNLQNDETERHRLSSLGGTDTARSTLQDLICGVGEVDLKKQEQHEEQNTDLVSFQSSQVAVVAPDFESLPYLLLDVRTPDEFELCHIIGALNYPMAMLSRTVNYFTKEILSFKNKVGKIILLYDEDERYATLAASTFVERGVDNVFMLSGGMKVLTKRFPDGFISGILPASCFPSPPATRRALKKPQLNLNFAPTGQHWEFFSGHHLQKIQDLLNEELLKQESNSRLSSRVSSRSSVASSSSRLSASSTSSKKPSWK